MKTNCPDYKARMKLRGKLAAASVEIENDRIYKYLRLFNVGIFTLAMIR